MGVLLHPESAASLQQGGQRCTFQELPARSRWVCSCWCRVCTADRDVGG
jgi:hypothetical protein